MKKNLSVFHELITKSVKIKAKVVPALNETPHNTDTCGSGSTAPCILKIRTVWRFQLHHRAVLPQLTVIGLWVRSTAATDLLK